MATTFTCQSIPTSGDDFVKILSQVLLFLLLLIIRMMICIFTL